jgi:hypothetical protein
MGLKLRLLWSLVGLGTELGVWPHGPVCMNHAVKDHSCKSPRYYFLATLPTSSSNEVM